MPATSHIQSWPLLGIYLEGELLRMGGSSFSLLHPLGIKLAPLAYIIGSKISYNPATSYFNLRLK